MHQSTSPGPPAKLAQLVKEEEEGLNELIISMLTQVNPMSYGPYIPYS
jgi:hypothetical protein